MAFPHSFQIDNLVWYEDFAPLGKNPKLTPKWQGPAKITEINDANARLLLPKGKTKILNMMCIKQFLKPASERETVSEQNELNFNSEQKITGPITRAMKKLLEQKKATEMVISVLCDLTKEHCSMCEWKQDCAYNPLFLTQFLQGATFLKDALGSLTNNLRALNAKLNWESIFWTIKHSILPTQLTLKVNKRIINNVLITHLHTIKMKITNLRN